MGRMAHRDRACDLIDRGRFDEADRLVREGLEADPDDGELWQTHGLLLRRAGDLEGARAAFETAATLTPLSPWAQCALAECYARGGQEEAGLGLYRHLAARIDHCPTVLLPMLASGLGTLGDHSAALAVCRERVRRVPDSAEGHFGAAFYLRRLGGSIDAVIPLIRRAHELAPHVATYRVALASLLAIAGGRQEAYELLRPVRIEEMQCASCLRRMLDVFRLAGDEGRATACRDRIDDAGNEP